MIKTKAIKGFDCVKMKRTAQAKIHRDIKGMSAKEEIEYFRHQANKGELGDWWRSLGKAVAKAA